MCALTDTELSSAPCGWVTNSVQVEEAMGDNPSHYMVKGGNGGTRKPRSSVVL